MPISRPWRFIVNVLHLDEQRGWRGGEQQASYLIRGLLKAGHNVSIAGRADTPFLERHGDIQARYALSFRGELDIVTAWKIARIIRAERIDIVHAHTSHTHTIALIAQFFARRGKIVVSRRVDFVPKNNLVNRWKYRSPDAVIAISGAIGQILRDYGVPAEKLHVVPSGIDPTRMDVAPISRSVLNIKPVDVPLFGNVAALAGHKDHATLINAMKLVIETLSDARLVIVGDGPLRSEIESQINDLSLNDNVILCGYRDDVPQLLRALDVFVMSSKEEGLGTSILDAMAAGIPVVATAAGGIPEMVKHEETGLLSPVSDASALAANMIRAFADTALRPTIVSGATALLHERFTADAMVRGNIEVYEKLLAK